MTMGFLRAPFNVLANFLNARPSRERALFIVFAGVLVFMADYFLWLEPVTRSLIDTWPAQSLLTARVEQLKDDQRSAPMIRKKYDAVCRQLEEMEVRIGASDQIAALLEDLSKLASDSGVRIMSLRPIENPPPAQAKLYYSVPIQISCVAGTHELGAFMMRLETGSIFFKITDLKINANPASERKHSVEMMVETYRKV